MAVLFSRPSAGGSAGAAPGADALSLSWRTGLAIALATPFLVVGASAAVHAVDIAFKRWRLRHIPGPPPSALLGNLPELIRRGGSYKAIPLWKEKYGPVFKFFILSHPFVVFTDADLNRQIAFKFANHSLVGNKWGRRINGRSGILDDNGLLQARDAMWRLLRNAWQPAFAPGTLARYYSIMVATADEVVQHLNGVLASGGKLPQGAPAAAAADGDGDDAAYIDIHDTLNKMTLDVVGRSAYGVNFHSLTPADQLPADAPGPALSKACKDVFSSTTVQVLSHHGRDASAPASTLIRRTTAAGCLTLPLACLACLQTGSKWGLAMALLPPLGPVLVPLALLFPDQALVRIRTSRQFIVDTSSKLIESFRSKLLASPAEGGDAKVADDGAVAPAGKLSGVEPGSFIALMVEADARARGASDRAAPKAPPQRSKEACRSSPASSGPATPLPSPAVSASGVPQPFVMSDVTIAAQANTFILAGTETTANTLSFAIYHLARHPEVEARLVKEVLAHGPPGTPLLLDDKFPYADAVISESLRVTPPAPATTRDMDKKEGAEVGGVRLPYPSAVLIPIYLMHNSEEYWPRAGEFLPERWLPEGEADLGPRNPHAYMPFGAGSRQCPGYKFALQEARIALVTLYKSYTFQLHPDLVGKPLPLFSGITLSPKHGIKVKVLPRAQLQPAAPPTAAA